MWRRKKMIYKLVNFKEGEELVEMLNKIRSYNHVVEAIWSTPGGVHAVITLWDEDESKQLPNEYVGPSND